MGVFGLFTDGSRLHPGKCARQFVQVAVCGSFCLALYCGGYATAEPIELSIKDPYVGYFLPKRRHSTGTYLARSYRNAEIVRAQDVPMNIGTFFGASMIVSSSFGRRLQIATIVEAPEKSGEKQTFVQLVENGGTVQSWIRLDRRLIEYEGPWTFSFFLLAVDEDIRTRKEDFSQLKNAIPLRKFTLNLFMGDHNESMGRGVKLHKGDLSEYPCSVQVDCRREY